MKKLFFLLFFLLFLTPQTWAVKSSPSPIVPENFAFGIPLTVKEPSTIYKFSIPKTVYENIDRKDFGDIRIFNSEKSTVPYSLKQKQTIKTSATPAIPLAFFPIIKTLDQNNTAFSLNINTDSTGAIINVHSDPANDKKLDISYYLIDLSALKQMPEKLQFEWISPDNNFSIRTRLEYSHNLTDWVMIRTDSTLAGLSFSGHALVKDKIDLKGASAKYLRMSWPVSGMETKITSMHALYPDKIQARSLEWKTISSGPFDSENNTLEYEIKGIFPLHSIALDFPVKNTVFKAVLKSRPDTQSEWKAVYTGLFYNIEIDQAVLNNEIIPVRTNTDRFWQLKFISAPQTTPKTLPRLKIGWVPHDLYFLNQGTQPFTAAFGNWEIEPAQNLVDQLFKDIDDKKQSAMVKDADPGTLFSLGPKNIKTDPLPWKKWLIWSVLIFGVLILGVMAIRLFRQMNA